MSSYNATISNKYLAFCPVVANSLDTTKDNTGGVGIRDVEGAIDFGHDWIVRTPPLFIQETWTMSPVIGVGTFVFIHMRVYYSGARVLRVISYPA